MTRKHVQGSLIVGIMIFVPACANQGGSGGRVTGVTTTEETPARSAMLGVRMGAPGTQLAQAMHVDPRKTTIINHVAPETPAMRGGLEQWDLVVLVNGSEDASPSAIRTILHHAVPGEEIDFEIVRKGVRRDVEIVLEPADSSRMTSGVTDGRHR
jgi:S1-C subfamily serine protease